MYVHPDQSFKSDFGASYWISSVLIENFNNSPKISAPRRKGPHSLILENSQCMLRILIFKGRWIICVMSSSLRFCNMYHHLYACRWYTFSVLQAARMQGHQRTNFLNDYKSIQDHPHQISSSSYLGNIRLSFLDKEKQPNLIQASLQHHRLVDESSTWSRIVCPLSRS